MPGPTSPVLLAALDGFGLVEIEQPLAAHDLVGSAEATRRLATPVCLDESIGSVADLETALALGALDHVNLKPGRVGGVAEALRIHDLGREAGHPAVDRGMLDTGVGKAVNVALTALAGATLPGDLRASRRWFAEDLTDPWEVASDGTIEVRPIGQVRLPPGELTRPTRWRLATPGWSGRRLPKHIQHLAPASWPLPHHRKRGLPRWQMFGRPV